MYFLSPDHNLYSQEKPYYLDYSPPDGIKRSNVELERFEKLHIEDIRDRLGDFTFEKTGFQLISLDHGMEYDDFVDKDKVEEVYLKHVAQMLQQQLGASRVQIYDWIVRKRTPEFPICTGDYYAFKQPSSTAHVDTTPSQTAKMLLELNPIEGPTLSHLHYQNVNVWKPLKGPIRDWPLALCDPNSIDRDKDLLARDTVRPDAYIETYQVHRKENHRWYYARDQMPNEAWVFLQSDSDEKGLPGVPHTGFDNPARKAGDVLRESIEVRTLVFYDN
ncbi:hypothetical protein DV736_g1710, partial [Chaetothyriales sp. CBS 134916]